MKIGIITLNGYENYGNLLQNYAVQEILRGFGAEVCTIWDSTEYGDLGLSAEKPPRKWSPRYIGRYLKTQLHYRFEIKNSGDSLLRLTLWYKYHRKEISDCRVRKREKCRAFAQAYISYADNSIDINRIWTSEESGDFAFFVTGSDQVWNPGYRAASSIKFLRFVPEEKRIALSPSFGVEEIPADIKEQYREWISEIPYLSVREKAGQEIIRKLTGRNARLLCDPTLALKADKWRKLEKRPDGLADGEYLLTCFLGDCTKEYREYISRTAQEYRLDVINLYDIKSLEYYDAAPDEFLYLIDHARLVFTDSFHGTAFSILFHKDFVVFNRKEIGRSMNSRLMTLLERFGMEGRTFPEIDKSDLFGTDHSSTDRILENCSDEMLSFLSDALSSSGSAVKAGKAVPFWSLYEDKAKCCGCSACAEICPAACITMERDEEGFLYPRTDQVRCLHCGLCRSVCPFQDSEEKGKQPPDDVTVYAGWSNDSDVRRQSSSGGLFSEIALHMLDRGGIVYGAGFNKDFGVEHIEITDAESLAILRGSKYVQSDNAGCYQMVQKRLGEGRHVFFTGTPCQVRGLYRYLDGQNVEKLITQDVVCHGVGSPLVWDGYISKWKKEGIRTISFRDKTKGWHYYSMKVETDRGSYCARMDQDFYLKLYLDNTILRPSCHACRAKEGKSAADITLGDCWKSRQVVPYIKDRDQGMNLILANSVKGRMLIEEMLSEERITCVETDYEKAAGIYNAMHASAKPGPRRASFFSSLKKMPVSRLSEIWFRRNLLKNLKQEVIYWKTKIKMKL